MATKWSSRFDGIGDPLSAKLGQIIVKHSVAMEFSDGKLMAESGLLDVHFASP
jgi:hypothetical protein